MAYDPSCIGTLVNIFLNVGLPVGGLMICLFLGFVWRTEPALRELEKGRPGTLTDPFGRLWPAFIRFFCPVTILLVFLNTIGVLQWLFC